MSKIEELSKLKKLLDSGLISLDEFEKFKFEIFEVNKNSRNESINHEVDISHKNKKRNTINLFKSKIDSKKPILVIIILILVLIFGILYVIPTPSQTSFIVQSGALLKTTDGGQTWSKLKGSLNNIELQKVFFIDDNTGYGIGSDGTGNYSTILKTSDGGASWIDLLELYDENLTKEGSYISLYFTDLNTGYVAGTNGIIIKTNDAGKSWELSKIDTNSPLVSILFTNVNEGYIIQAYKGSILKTVDAGKSWNLIKIEVDKKAEDYRYFMHSIDFTDLDTGYIVGEKQKTGTIDDGHSRLILKTTDGGVTWSSLLKSEENNSKIERLSSVCFVNSNIGFIISSGGKIMKTIDRGYTWNKNIIGENLSSVFFFDEKSGYVTDSNDAIFYTDDGGDTWTKSSIL
jgi:photosystem II stability/assembly factor-like uncharacterized protein